jgi:ankyrin repeat protein
MYVCVCVCVCVCVPCSFSLIVFWFLFHSTPTPISVMVQTNSGTMPLHYLMQTGYPKEQEELAHQCLLQMLQLGADPNFQTLHGESPLHYACWGVGLPRNVLLLLKEGANPNVLNQKGNAPLHYAILQNRLQLVNLLVRHRANVDLESSIGGTCRELAAQTKSAELIEYV